MFIIVVKDKGGNVVTARSLVYVMQHGGDLLSREDFRHLGVLPPELGSLFLIKLASTWLVLLAMRIRKLWRKKCFSHLVSVILRVAFLANVL